MYSARNRGTVRQSLAVPPFLSLIQINLTKKDTIPILSKYAFVYLYPPAFIQSQLYSSFHIVSLSSSYFTLSFVMCALLNFCNDMFTLSVLNQIFFLSSLFSHSLQRSHYKLLNHTTLYKVVF